MSQFPSTTSYTSSPLVGTTTVVFGGSDGMGKASARQVLDLGGKVVLVARNLEKLAAVQAELLAGRPEGSVEYESCDCFRAEAVEAFFAKREAGSLHHLVVTLGPAVHGCDDIFGAATLELVRKQFGKFEAPWLVAKYGAPLLADGGSLVFFSGTLAHAVMKNSSCLASVNGAVQTLARSLAVDVAPRLRVNCVSPTLTRTSAVTGGMTPEAAEGMFTGFGKSIPAGRSGEAADIGHAVGFLLTNGFMTGSVLEVDGGKCL